MRMGGAKSSCMRERDRIVQREAAARRMGEIMRGIDVGSYGFTSFCVCTGILRHG